MENNKPDNLEEQRKDIKSRVKKSSSIENFGKLSLQVGEKLGKVVTEWFTGKPLSEEEKLRRKRLKELKLIQEEAEYQKNLELARNGQYVPPAPKEKPKKKQNDVGDIISNLGKHNPLGDFNKTQSIGTKNFGVESYGGVGAKTIKREDIELPSFSNNPLGTKRRN